MNFMWVVGTLHLCSSVMFFILQHQLIPDCNKIISVYRTRLGDCERFVVRRHWNSAIQYKFLLDYIFKNLFSLFLVKTLQVQRPSQWIIDMTTEQVIRRFEILEYLVQPGHGLVSLKVGVD